MTAFVVTGPDTDRRAVSASVGLSAAITSASRVARSGSPASFYVRDAQGGLVGRVDADGFGGVVVWGEAAIAAYRASGRLLPEAEEVFDRAATDGGVSGYAVRRRSAGPTAQGRGTPEEKNSGSIAHSRGPAESGPTRPATKERKMAATKKKAAAGRKPATTTKSTADAKTDGKPSEEKGTDLLAALMQQVEREVAGVRRSPNASETYTRLQTPAGKTFAYVFPPRPTGLSVKIPKQLLAVEAELPSGHGFHKTNWGLTRTIKKASETAVVAKAFAVAAAKAAPAAASSGEGGESS